MSKKIFLVDGSGYIFRAFYAITSLRSKDGFPTNALYGFTRMLLKLLSDADSDHVAVVFDAGRKTFRNDLYPDYKANRAECPPDLQPQMPVFREICDALGLQVLEKPGYEADDIIGTMATRFAAENYKVVIVSGDKDLCQLVSDTVEVWDTMKDRHLGPKEVVDKLGVPPEKVVELLGLMGDSSDNVPGLKGVGPKTAQQLVEIFSDIEGLISRVDELKDNKQIRNRVKIAEAIELNADSLRLSRQLVEIHKNVPISLLKDGKDVNFDEIPIEDAFQLMLRRSPSGNKLYPLFDRLEFTSLLRDLSLDQQGESAAQEGSQYEYKIVLSADFNNFVEALSSQKEFAFDLETTSLDVLEAELVGASFCWSDEEAFYIPLGHVGLSSQVSVEDFLKAVGPILSQSSSLKVGQNIKYDIEVLSSYGVKVAGVSFDTMLASYVLNPDRRSHGLTALSRDYLGLQVIEYTEIVPKGEDFSAVPIETAKEYACQDAHFCWLIKRKLQELLEEAELVKLYNDIELPLVSVLAGMELKGVKLDLAFLSTLSETLDTELQSLTSAVYEISGVEFNLNSTKQLADVLFNKLGISTKGVKRTKTGFSTDSSVLEKLEGEHKIAELLLRYRMLHKLKSTYVDSLPRQVSDRTGRLHARFNQVVTATGRLSSSDPNLQNIPIQTSEGRQIRKAFIAEEGNVLISADYSQIELRILAHLANDENLISAFRHNQDVHARTAMEVLGLESLSEVTTEKRRLGKVINFGVIYGMGPYRLARELGIPNKVAQDYIDSYFERYSGVKDYFGVVEKEMESKGYVSTLFGRRRLVEAIDTSGRDEGFQRRAALNAPIQGTAADIIKLAMVDIAGRIEKSQFGLSLIMQIHDELVFECKQSEAEAFRAMIVEAMEGVVDLAVPLKVEASSGQNWDEAHG